MVQVFDAVVGVEPFEQVHDGGSPAFMDVSVADMVGQIRLAVRGLQKVIIRADGAGADQMSFVIKYGQKRYGLIQFGGRCPLQLRRHILWRNAIDDNTDIHREYNQQKQADSTISDSARKHVETKRESQSVTKYMLINRENQQTQHISHHITSPHHP